MSEEVFRLSWEAIAPHRAAAIEDTLGRGCWPDLPWDDFEWRATSVEFTGNERMGQYQTLKRWADTREQPIRNVRLERTTRTVSESVRPCPCGCGPDYSHRPPNWFQVTC